MLLGESDGSDDGFKLKLGSDDGSGDGSGDGSKLGSDDGAAEGGKVGGSITAEQLREPVPSPNICVSDTSWT